MERRATPMPARVDRPIIFDRGIWLAAGAGLAFLCLAALVATGYRFAFDRSLMLLFRQPGDPATPLGPGWLVETVRDMTAFGSSFALVVMVTTASLALWTCGQRRLALGLVVSVCAALLACNGLKVAIGRARPDIVVHEARIFTASFPSSHAFMSTVTLLGIAGCAGLASQRRDVARLGLALALVMIALIGVSRIYLGVHWPSDVLGGWLLGIAWTGVAMRLIARPAAGAPAS